MIWWFLGLLVIVSKCIKDIHQNQRDGYHLFVECMMLPIYVIVWTVTCISALSLPELLIKGL